MTSNIIEQQLRFNNSLISSCRLVGNFWNKFLNKSTCIPSVVDLEANTNSSLMTPRIARYPFSLVRIFTGKERVLAKLFNSVSGRSLRLKNLL